MAGSRGNAYRQPGRIKRDLSPRPRRRPDCSGTAVAEAPQSKESERHVRAEAPVVDFVVPADEFAVFEADRGVFGGDERASGETSTLYSGTASLPAG